MNFWPKLIMFLVAGYLAMSRSFAYLGYPQPGYFIGEAAIAAFLILKPRAIFDRLPSTLFQPSLIGAFSAAFVCSLLYGVLELVRGLAAGYSPVLALQGFAFHYYPVCFFIGLWAGAREPNLLARTIRLVAWCNGIYGLLYLAFLNKIPLGVPGTTDVQLFGQPAGSAIAVLGLLCVERRISRVWLPLLLNLVVMLGIQVRAEYLGFTLGLVLWSFLTRRFGLLLGSYGAIAALLIVGLLADIRVQAPGTRGGVIASQEIIGRVLAPR